MKKNIKLFPVTTDEEFDKAHDIIEYLLPFPEGSEEEKLLEAFTILASDYEKRNYSIPKPDPIEALKYKMQELDLSQKDIAEYFGGENRVSEVLNRKPALSLRMLKNMHKYLGIPSGVLLK